MSSRTLSSTPSQPVTGINFDDHKEGIKGNHMEGAYLNYELIGKNVLFRNQPLSQVFDEFE